MSPPPPTRSLVALTGAATLLLLAVGLSARLATLPWHQNVWGVDWLAYYEPQARHLRSGWLPGYLFSWEGLHPPLSGTVHGLGMALGVSQWAHWGGTLAASLLAPVALGIAVGRRTLPPAALLVVGVAAVSPLQANYGLNTSPYPWTLLLVAASSAALLRALEGSERTTWLLAGVLSALTAQVHVLALAAVGAQALFVASRVRERNAQAWAALVGLSGLLVVGGSLLKTGDPWTFHIGEGDETWLRQVQHVLRSRFVGDGGNAWLGGWLAVGAVAGLFTRARGIVLLLGAQIAAWLLAQALFYELHVADPRLTHYFVVPHLLLIGAAAAGFGGVAERLGRAGPFLVLLVAAGLAPWAGEARAWHADRASRAQAEIEASAAEPVRAAYEAAGEGDVVAYLWGYRFLNDEPEELDAVSARWPTQRLGRPCFDIEEPRHRCNAHGGARFWFAPSDFSGDMESQEEELRIMINGAQAPGRAVLVVSPGADPPARPWPVEAWLAEHGAESSGPLEGGVILYRFPPGTRIPDPPPLHPSEPPAEDPEP